MRRLESLLNPASDDRINKERGYIAALDELTRESFETWAINALRNEHGRTP